MSSATSFQVDLEHPWLGLDSFSEETKDFFFGRDAEVAELQLRLRGPLPLVLYGRSGRGKTSLLRAGLIPRLRKEGYRPVFYRLTYERDQASPLEQFLSLLGARDQSHGFSFSLPSDAASRLWIHLHGKDFASGISHLILDQFEEVFTVGARRSGAEEEVRQALAIVCQEAVPEPVRPLLAAEESFLDYFGSDLAPLRLILAVRDDYFYALNRWRPYLPHLGQNCFELRELSGRTAFDAVYKPGTLRTSKRIQDGQLIDAQTELPPLLSKETAQRIVRLIAEAGRDAPLEHIEAVPPILSMLCRELNERRIAEKTPQIVFDERETDVEKILDQFYQRCITGRPEAVRIFIEDELVSHSGIRLQNDEDSFVGVFPRSPHAAGHGDRDAAIACLRELVNQRLLSPVSGGKNPRYELTHDLLCRVVYKSRTARQERLEKERLEHRAKEEIKAKEDAARQRELEVAQTLAAEQAERAKAEAERAMEAERRLQIEEKLRRAVEERQAGSERLVFLQTRVAVRLRWLTCMLALVAVAAVAAAIFGFWQKRQTEKQTVLARDASSRANVSLARYSQEAGNEARALAHLAQALRLDQRNYEAVALIGAMLTQTNWPIPVDGLMRHNSAIVSAQFSPDGQRVVTASEIGRRGCGMLLSRQSNRRADEA